MKNLVGVACSWVDQAWPSRQHINSNVYMVGFKFLTRQDAEAFLRWVREIEEENKGLASDMDRAWKEMG